MGVELKSEAFTMFTEYLAIITVLVLSILGNNTSVAYAAIIVLALKVLGLTSLLQILGTDGLNWGIILLTVAILVPLATGEITVGTMVDSFKSPIGIVAIVAGALAAYAGGSGVTLLKEDPRVVPALIIGTMIGVFFFRGVAVGPLIAGGLTYFVLRVVSMIR